MHVKFEKSCSNCDILIQLLESEKASNRMLLERILQLTQPRSEAPQTSNAAQQDFKPIKLYSRRQHQQMLEEEDKRKYQVMNQNLKEIKNAELKLDPAEEFDIDKELAEVNDNA